MALPGIVAMLYVCADSLSWRHEPHRPKALPEKAHTVGLPRPLPTKLCVNKLLFSFSQASLTSGPKDVLKVPRVSEDEHHQLPGRAFFFCRRMWFSSPSPIWGGAFAHSAQDLIRRSVSGALHWSTDLKIAQGLTK